MVINSPEATVETPEARRERIRIDTENVKWTIVHKDVPTTWHNGQDPSIRGWFWDFSPAEGPLGRVYADETDLDGPDGYSKAIAGHEYSHVLIDKPGLFTKEELNKRGFLIGYNWVDDNAVENYLMAAHRRGRSWIKVKAEEDIKPGGKLDHRQEALIEQKLGYIPKHMLLGGMTRQYFYKKEVTGELNINGLVGPNAQIDPEKLREFMDDESYPQEVRDVFKELHDDGAIEDLYRAIPSAFVKEELIDAIAQNRIDIYRDRIWPKYKKLVEDAYSDQSLIEFIKKLIDGQDVEGQENGHVIIIDFDSLPPEVQQEIIDAFSQSGAGQQSQGSGQDSAESGQEGQTGESAGEAGGQPQSGPNTQSPIDKLSPEAKEAVQKAFDKSTDAEKKQLDKEATQAIGGVEDELNQKLSPQTNKEGKSVKSEVAEKGSESGQDGEEQGGEEQDGGEEQGGDAGDMQGNSSQGSENQAGDVNPDKQSQVGKDKPPRPTPPQVDYSQVEREIEELVRQLEQGQSPEKIETYLDGLTADQIERDSAEFDKFWSALAEMEDWADDLSEELWPVLRPDRRPQRRFTRRPNNAKFNTRRYLRENLTKGMKFWEKTERFEETSVGITYLIDLSGSTQSYADDGIPFDLGRDQYDPNNVHRTILGKELELVASATKAQMELRVRTEVQGFPGKRRTMEVYVPATTIDDVGNRDELSSEVKAGLWGMVKESGGNTPTKAALRQSYERLIMIEDQHPEMRRDINFIIVPTDGQPDSGPGDVKNETEAIYRDAENRGINLVIMFIGVGPGTEFVNTLSPPLPEYLREALTDRLSEIRGVDVNPDSVGTSFATAGEAALAYPLILDEMMRHPSSFREGDFEE